MTLITVVKADPITVVGFPKQGDGANHSLLSQQQSGTHSK